MESGLIYINQSGSGKNSQGTWLFFHFKLGEKNSDLKDMNSLSVQKGKYHSNVIIFDFLLIKVLCQIS